MTPLSATPHSERPAPQYPSTLPALDPSTLPAQYAPSHSRPSAEPFPPAYPKPMRSVARQRAGISHGLHLFLTIITAGAWGVIVWLPLTMWHKVRAARRRRYIGGSPLHT